MKARGFFIFFLIYIFQNKTLKFLSDDYVIYKKTENYNLI